MPSKTQILSIVKALDWKSAEAEFSETPELVDFRDDRGRSLLHHCAMVNVSGDDDLTAENSLKMASLLIEKGLDPSEEAFARGNWKATPLWHAVSLGKNVKLAEFLLNKDCDPNHCLWSACFDNNEEVIRLLVSHGADVDPIYENEETPLMTAVKGGHWEAAKTLLDLGADVNYQDSNKRTSLHWALKNRATKDQVRILLENNARGDIRDVDGDTSQEIMMRKKDPEYQTIASEFFAEASE